MSRARIAIECLPNLGSKSAAWLRECGIETVNDLQRIGPVNAWLAVKESQPRASLNLLWALAAGLQNRDWRDLSEAEKRQLKAELP